jgi:hypothetical protein
MIGINTLVDARYYGEDAEDKDFYPGVVVGFSRDGFMIKFEEYEDDPVQDTKPEDVRVYTIEKTAQTSGSRMSTARQSEQDKNVESAKPVGLPFQLPLGDKRKNRPYVCSAFCEENLFYHCGGCPTCNDYYKSIGRRNPHVLLDKRKVLVKHCEPDKALVESHYTDVCKKNPMWLKDNNGIPIVPKSFVPLTVPRAVRRPSKKTRIEDAYEAHDNAVHAAAVAEKSKAVSGEPLPYKCSHYCEKSMFAMAGGCPTCNVYYDLIGGINPKVVRGEGIVHEKYNEMILRKHYDIVSKNNPEWAKDEAGNPVVPDTYGKTKA